MLKKTTRSLLKELYPLLVTGAGIFYIVAHNASKARGSFAAELLLFIILFAIIVFSALKVVRHAEAIAAIFGDPIGTMLLTFSAMSVEIVMIASIMTNAENDPYLVRDTVFSSMMIYLNGLAGIALIIGGMRHGEQGYNIKGTRSYQSIILMLTGLTFFVPGYVSGDRGTFFGIFLIGACLALYVYFIRLQSGKHRHFFNHDETPSAAGHSESGAKGEIPWRQVAYHAVFLLLAILGTSVLAHELSLMMDDDARLYDLPSPLVGLVIGVLIAAPEGITAIRAAYANKMQRSFNIIFGSTLSTIALTIPLAKIFALSAGQQIVLGGDPLQGIMIVMTLVVIHLTVSDGATNTLDGIVQLALFASFVVMAVVS